MTDTTVATGLTVQQWDDQFFTEYFQENRFKSDMGSSENSIIQVKEDLTKKKGDIIHFALVNRLTGAGVTGNTTMEGSEEDLDSRSHSLQVTQRRNAVRSSAYDEQLSAIDLREAAKVALQDWAQENTRDRIITALGSINGTAYGSASEAAKDAWLVDNGGTTGRVLFGDAIGNGSYTDHSADLATVTAAMTFGAAEASLMKRMALRCNPKIKPIRSTTTGRRYYKVYVNSYAFRDLKNDSVIQQAQRDVGLRMQNEKLFNGGDIEWDGMIFCEIDDIAVVSGVGATSGDLAPVYLCGQQALAYAISKRWNTVEEVFDYEDKHGVCVREFGNFNKLTFGTGSDDTDDPVDHGVLTGWFSAVADA